MQINLGAYSVHEYFKEIINGGACLPNSMFILSPLKSESLSSLNSPFTTAVPSQWGAGFETKKEKVQTPVTHFLHHYFLNRITI